MVCCKDLEYHTTNRCIHHDKWACPDSVLVKLDSIFGLPVKDGGSSFIQIKFCPFCGAKLKENNV